MQALIRLALLLFAFASATAWSQGHVRYETMNVLADIRADGTFTNTIEMQYKLLTQEGVSSSASFPISYMADRQRYKLFDAYTLKANGQKIPLPSENIQIQKGLAQGDRAISYQHFVNQLHRFADVAIGDSIYFRYEVETFLPDFSGHYTNYRYLTHVLAWDQAQFTFRYPKAMPLQFAHQNFTESVASSDTHMERRFTIGATPSKNLEAQGLNNWKETPHVIVTSFADAPAMASAYRDTETPKKIITPQLQSLANEITAGITEPRAQFKALYDWMGKNIRYVAVYYGQGGFIPNDIDDILKNRFGDCKDQTLLLQTLALAKGIDAHTVLLMSDTQNYATPALATANNYNHVIVYVPALKLFADPTTANDIRFGDLPLADMAKQVLSVKDGAFLATPSPKADKDTMRRKVVWTIDAAGDANVELTFTAEGRIQNEIVALRKSIEPGKEAVWMKERIRGFGAVGEGTMRFATVNGVVGGKFLTIKHSLKNAVVQDQGVLSFATIYSGPITFQQALQTYLSPSRFQDYWCMPMTVKDSFEIRWEGEMEMFLPKDVQISDGVYTWSSRFKQQGKVITAERELSVNTPSVACSVSDYAKHRDTVQKIDRAARAQIVYRKS
jgi:transglutaminase-like putative cysteine protease